MNQPEPTGAVRIGPGGPEIAINRVIDRPIEEVWSFLTESELLARWYGTWSGDPAEGVVQLFMVEAPDIPGECQIKRCERPRILDLIITNPEDEAWKLEVVLDRAGDQTHLMFRQPLEGVAADAGDIGPGWEYYLDRLTAAVHGRSISDIDFSCYHPRQVQHYQRAPEEN